MFLFPADVIQRSYAWETFSSRSSSPSDSGSVAVLDGGQLHFFSTFLNLIRLPTATILLTPFRTQNIPPPMASHQLPIPRDVLTGRPLLPVHVAFSPHKDILASLWETGYIEVTNLRTRLGPGKGGIVDPILLWSGSCNAEDSNPSGNYRQVLLWNDQIETGVSDALHIVALGSGPGTMDFLVAQFVVDGQVQQRAQVNLPERDGRLLRSDGTIAWQSPSGEVVTSALSFFRIYVLLI